MIKKHDKVGKGFNISPKQLAHELTMLKLAHSGELTGLSTYNAYYELYTRTLHEFTKIIDDKTRYDSSFKD